jgi:hypothetical protein
MVNWEIPAGAVALTARSLAEMENLCDLALCALAWAMAWLWVGVVANWFALGVGVFELALPPPWPFEDEALYISLSEF